MTLYSSFLVIRQLLFLYQTLSGHTFTASFSLCHLGLFHWIGPIRDNNFPKYTLGDQINYSNFKKPGVRQHLASICLV